MGKPRICQGENKGADQLRSYSSSSTKIRNFKFLALFGDCTGRFMSDLAGNHIVGFTTRRLICNKDSYPGLNAGLRF